MSIEDLNMIDAIGISDINEKIIMKIFDHLDFSDEEAHLLLLQEKINRYFSFIESREITETFDDAFEREIVISIDFKYTPTRFTIEFLREAGKIAEEAGYSMEFSIWNE
jgi:hypothetical protein